MLDVFRKLKEEGLVRHICVSSHLIGDEIKELLQEAVFEGVLLGYSAYNFRVRSQAFDAVREQKLGCTVMNPLGGGIIPRHPELFSELVRQEGESVVQGALRFLIAHPDIAVVLVGLSNLEQLREAITAVESYQQISADELEGIKQRLSGSLEGLCTGCGYCKGCPEDIDIPKLMDSYNQKLLTEGGDTSILEHLKFHWRLPQTEAAKCISCGLCEQLCCQHLPIIQRLEEIANIPS